MNRQFDARIRRLFFGFGPLRLEIGELRHGDTRILLGPYAYRTADFFLLHGIVVVAWPFYVHPSEELASQICSAFGTEQIWFVASEGLCRFEHVPANAVAIA